MESTSCDNVKVDLNVLAWSSRPLIALDRQW